MLSKPKKTTEYSHTNFNKNNTNISRQTRSVGKEEVRQCGNVAGLWKEKNQQEYADKNNIWEQT